jgi:hypothetical protein
MNKAQFFKIYFWPKLMQVYKKYLILMYYIIKISFLKPFNQSLFRNAYESYIHINRGGTVKKGESIFCSFKLVGIFLLYT